MIFIDEVSGLQAKAQAGKIAFGTAVPIAGIAGDQQAALFGQACFSAGLAKNTYGTGCFFLLNLAEKKIAPDNGLILTLVCGPDGTPCYALDGCRRSGEE